MTPLYLSKTKILQPERSKPWPDPRYDAAPDFIRAALRTASNPTSAPVAADKALPPAAQIGAGVGKNNVAEIAWAGGGLMRRGPIGRQWRA